MNINQENQDKIQSLEAKVEQLTQELQAKDARLEETKKLLCQREKLFSLGEMAASIFHDFKNYLSSIHDNAGVNLIRCQYLEKMFSEARECLGEERGAEIFTYNLEEGDILLNLKESLVDTENEVKQILRITEDINIYLYNQQGQKLPQQKPNLLKTNINDIVAECLDLACQAGELKKQQKGQEKIKINLETDYDGAINKFSLPVKEIKRILINLIDNAYYAVYEKKEKKDYLPTILVKTELGEQEIKIIIRDNGTGIPLSIKRKFAQPFFTTKPLGEGTGLGLNIVTKLLEKIQGYLSQMITRTPQLFGFISPFF